MVEEEYEYKAPKKITTYKPKSTDNEVITYFGSNN